MNERIKELAEQNSENLSNVIRTDEWLEKFAELVVRECVYVLEENISPLQMKIFASKYPELIPMSSLEIQDRNRNGQVEGLLLGAEAIEQYFGVEE
jgi:hypothetical protein